MLEFLTHCASEFPGEGLAGFRVAFEVHNHPAPTRTNPAYLFLCDGVKAPIHDKAWGRQTELFAGRRVKAEVAANRTCNAGRSGKNREGADLKCSVNSSCHFIVG